jgi:hypothetical protein
MKGEPYMGFDIVLIDPEERGHWYGQVYAPDKEEAEWQTSRSYRHAAVAILECVKAIHRYRTEGEF